MYNSSSAAINSAIKSVDNFHNQNMYKYEFGLVTKNYKYADTPTQEAFRNLIISGEPGPNVRIKHACLIGYDLKKYNDLDYSDTTNLLKNFQSCLQTDGIRLTDLIQKRFDSFEKKHLCFEVFFIPFPSVQEFRNAFNAALD